MNMFTLDPRALYKYKYFIASQFALHFFLLH